jgi:flagellar hook-length control protein FliK
MNISTLPQLLANWLKTQGTALLDQGKTAPAPAKDSFQPGANYQGRVLENLPAGRSLVQVDGQNLNMALPRGTQAGDTIRLTYLTNMPRPTFVMEQPSVNAAQPVRLSQTAQQLTALAQLARPAASAAAPGSAQASILSNTAPLASPPSLAGGAAFPTTALSGAFTTATALTGATQVDATRAGLASGSTTSNLAALQPGAADSQAALPQRLHQTLRESGMFYEAHLARWSNGTFQFADLRNEPQSRLVAGQASPNLPAELAGMPEQAARLAGQQLQMLEGAPFLWQGFVWPGQWMDWQVQERPGDESGSPDEPATWATELKLTLPRMGGVTARITLAGARLTVGLRAGQDDTRAALSAALPELEQALAAAGLKPSGLSVEQPDAALTVA